MDESSDESGVDDRSEVDAATDEARTEAGDGDGTGKQDQVASRPPERPIEDLRMPTWELELLISGAVVFSLLKAPGHLREMVLDAAIHMPQSLFSALLFVVIYLQTASYTLIFSFLLHLAGRAYWIGLIGLHSIFPRGIDWSNVKLGPKLTAIYRRKLSSLDELIRQSGFFCSAIFSFAFSVVIIFIVSMVLGGALFGAAVLLSGLVPVFDQQTVSVVLFVVVFMPYVVLMGIDKAFGARLQGRAGRWLEKSLSFFGVFFGVQLVNAVQLTFSSNMKRRTFYPLMYTLIFGGLALSMVLVFRDLGILSVSGYSYFPRPADPGVVQARFYRALEPEPTSPKPAPSIQSDLITDRYVKLFLPYSPSHNEDLAAACPGVEPFAANDAVRFGQIVDWGLETERLDEVRACFAAIWRVELDEILLGDLRLEFHVLPTQKRRGMLAYLPVAGLDPGRHVLTIERLRPSRDASATSEASKADTGAGKEDTPDGGPDQAKDAGSDSNASRRIFEIPFWL